MGFPLGDDHHAVLIVGVHDVARVHEPQAGAAADRRGDARIGELQAGVVDRRLVGLDRSLELAEPGGLVVELLLRDDSLGTQLPVARQRQPGVLELRAVARQLPLGLLELHLERPRVDLGEEVALVNELALPEGHVDELAVDPALHRHGVEGGDRPEAGQIDGEVAGSCRRHHHRHRRSLRRLDGGRRAPSERGSEPVRASGQREQGEQPRPPAALQFQWHGRSRSVHVRAGRCRATIRRPAGVPTPRMKTSTTAATRSPSRSPSAR